MGYIGNQTSNSYTSLDKQDLTGVTGSPAKRGFTLDHAVANANEIEVFVNNVRQEPTDAYTVSGTALTMTGDVETTDDFYVIFQGKALQSVTPPDNSVTKSMIVATELDLATIKDSTGTNTALTIDSSGRVFKPATPAFHAYADDGAYQTTSPIPFDNTTIDVGSAFDTTNKKYVVPVTGNYLIMVHVGTIRSDSNGEYLSIYLKKGSTTIQQGYTEETSSQGYGNISFSAIHALTAGDELTVTTGGNGDYFASSRHTIFSGYLIG